MKYYRIFSASLLSLSLIVPFLVAPFTTYAAADTTPPVLRSMKVTPASVDTTTASAAVIFNFVVTDDLSGVNYIHFNLVYPGNTLQAGPPINCLINEQSLVAPQTATCTTVFTFPAHSLAGDYKILFYTGDVAGNYTNMSSSDLAASGFPSTIHVTSN